MTLSISGTRIEKQHCRPPRNPIGDGNAGNPSNRAFNANKLISAADQYSQCLQAESTDGILNAEPDFNPYKNRHGRFTAALLRAYGLSFFYDAVDHNDEDKKARDKTRTLAAAISSSPLGNLSQSPS